MKFRSTASKSNIEIQKRLRLLARIARTQEGGVLYPDIQLWADLRATGASGYIKYKKGSLYWIHEQPFEGFTHRFTDGVTDDKSPLDSVRERIELAVKGSTLWTEARIHVILADDAANHYEIGITKDKGVVNIYAQIGDPESISSQLSTLRQSLEMEYQSKVARHEVVSETNKKAGPSTRQRKIMRKSKQKIGTPSRIMARFEKQYGDVLLLGSPVQITMKSRSVDVVWGVVASLDEREITISNPKDGTQVLQLDRIKDFTPAAAAKPLVEALTSVYG